MSDRTINAVLPSVLLFTGTLLLYLITLCPTVYWGDAAEFAWVVPGGGIAHPSGYPLFSVLARLLAMLPAGEVAARVNAMAALAGAGAVVATYHAGRALRLSELACAGAAACFALNGELWLQSTAAEVYSLHALLLAVALLLALRAARSGRAHVLGVLGLVCGLSFSNHLTTVLWAPALLVLLWPRLGLGEGRFPLRAYLLAGLGLLAGLLPYLYLPLISSGEPIFDQGNPQTWSNFLAHVSGEQYRYRLFALAASQVLAHAGEDLLDLALRGTPLALLGGLLGLGLLWRRLSGVPAESRRLSLGLIVLILSVLVYVLNYNIPDRSGYLLPVDLALALGTAAAIEWIARRCLAHGSIRGRLALIVGLVLAVLAVQLVSGTPGRRGERSLHEYSAALLVELPRNAVVFCEDLELFHGLRYLQTVEGRRLDVTPVAEYLLRLPWYLEQLRRDAPGIAVPDDADRALAARLPGIAAADGRTAGSLSQQLVGEVARIIAGANLGARPVFRCPHEDKEWGQHWLGFPVRYRGLAYEVSRQRRADEDFGLDHLPPAAGHLRQAQPDSRARFVIGRYSVAFNRRAIVRARMGRVDDALADLKIALAYDPEYGNVYKNLGVMHAEYRKDLEAARPYWEEFLRRSPDDPQAATIRKKLAR